MTSLILILTECDYANSQLGFNSFSIYGIVCEGKSFFFASTQVPTLRPFPALDTVLPVQRATLSVADLSSHSTMDFIASLRPICKIIFCFLILSYLTGIYAQYQLSCSRGEQNGENLPLPGSHSRRLPLWLPASMSKRTKLRRTLPNVLKQGWFWLFAELGGILS